MTHPASGSLLRLAAFTSDPAGGNPAGVWTGPDRWRARDPFPVGGVVEDPTTGAAATAFRALLRDHGVLVAPATFQPGSCTRANAHDPDTPDGSPTVATVCAACAVSVTASSGTASRGPPGQSRSSVRNAALTRSSSVPPMVASASAIRDASRASASE